ncbi:hypothetical protein [Zhihengliuella flava]|uniref:SAF domain-containing protein n=1 Tax=Zhihengliuella flava TaxID=1285193 RepID=A0A931D8I7_9MICC|nr:hypothetical protein [Zhihengliuella flava]MBG6085615.1 hypothetical protein [Zhihengliuella flava]
MNTETAANSNDARRLQRPGWRDPRLLIGLLLIIVSVVAVVALVSAMDRTISVYAAKTELTVGDPVTAEQLDVVSVRIDGLEGHYLPADEELDPAARAAAFVPAGELVPRRALEGIEAQGRKPVAVPIAGTVADAITAGAYVDVWAAQPHDSGSGYGEPTKILSGLEVAAVEPVETGFGGTSGTTLELLVTDEDLPALLGALAADAKMTVIYAPAGANQ